MQERHPIFSTPGLKVFIDRIGEIENPSVLDLGYTSGANVQFLANLGCTVYLSATLREIFSMNSEINGDPLDILLSENLNYSADSFHGILCWDLFDYFEREHACLISKKLSKILRKKGIVFIMSSRKSYSDLSSEALLRYAIVNESSLQYIRIPGQKVPRWSHVDRDIIGFFAGFNLLSSHLIRSGIKEFLFEKL